MRDHNILKKNTARLSVISNTLLVIFKLMVGFYTGAVSIISEGVHSGVDLMAALVAWYAVGKASEPPDEHHAYGHGKIENLSATFEAVLIVIAAVWIVYESVEKFGSGGAPVFLEWGIVIMFISMVANYWVSRRLFEVARKTCSQALEADATHLRADVWTSVGVLAGVVIMKITGFYYLDPLIAIAVAVMVFKAGYQMTKQNLYELTDVSLPEEEEAAIRDIINNHPGVITFHRLRTRRSGAYRLIDVHVIMNKNMHLDKAHAICDQIELAIKVQLGACDVVIHLEPCGYYEGFGSCPLAEGENKIEKE